MKQKPIKITPKSREEWLQYKKKTIGGSEIAAICGLNKFTTPYQIWRDKLGLTEQEEPNWAMRLGIEFEPVIAKLFESEYQHRIIKNTASNTLYFHPEHNFLSVTPDRLFYHREHGKEKWGLEIKTTNQIFDYDQVPKSWIIQGQWMCGILGLKHFCLVWFEFRTRELKVMEYDFNQEVFNSLVDLGIDFWTNHVETGVEPELQNSSDVLVKYPTEKDGKFSVATKEVETIYSEIKGLQEKVKPLTDEIEQKKEAIKLFMTDSEAVFAGDTKLFTWKANAKGTRVFMIK